MFGTVDRLDTPLDLVYRGGVLESAKQDVRFFTEDRKMRKKYTKPSFRKLGLLRKLTRFSF